MKHKVSELDGALLDRAVAMAEGYELDADGDNRTIRENGGAPSAWHPSTDPRQGDEIIDRERIGTWFEMDCWNASSGIDSAGGSPEGIGPTRLIAAMRARVANKFGDEVDLPS